MSFRFDPVKTTQAAAFLLAREPKQTTEYLRLLKLLYIADRESVKETHRPITGDEVWAMKLGPVLDGTYNLLKTTATDRRWKDYISTTGYCVQLIADPGKGQLALYERRKLADVSERYRDHSWKEISEVTHDFPEWSNPGNSAYFIPLRLILTKLGLDPAEVDEIEQDRMNEKHEDFMLKRIHEGAIISEFMKPDYKRVSESQRLVDPKFIAAHPLED